MLPLIAYDSQQNENCLPLAIVSRDSARSSYNLAYRLILHSSVMKHKERERITANIIQHTFASMKLHRIIFIKLEYMKIYCLPILKYHVDDIDKIISLKFKCIDGAEKIAKFSASLFTVVFCSNRQRRRRRRRIS